MIFPTLLAILLINFIIIQSAPGGPVERFLAQMNHAQKAGSESVVNDLVITQSATQNISKYRGSEGVDDEMIAKIEKIYGFNLPAHERFFVMVKKYLIFDFGESFYQDKKVIDMIAERLPVSASIGFWSMLLIYGISIPLGIKKAIKDGSKFDIISSSVVILLYAIPSFLFAILLVLLFCGGNFLNIFPLKGLVSANFSELNWWQKIIDYFWHMALPIASATIGGFAALTFFVKNSFIEELGKQYVISAAAKGLSQRRILYRHVFRNAMLVIIAGLPAALLGVIFGSSMLIEIIFSLDGLGLMGYEAVLTRDYPVVFATLYIFTLLGLVANLLSDLAYRLVDPRINFNKK